MPFTTRPLLMSLVLGVCATSAMHAEDYGFSVGPQVLIGTNGVEPGVAGEFRFDRASLWSVRPEVFISNDGKVGAGGSLLWRTPVDSSMPRWSFLSVGPRAVYHNADDAGTEVGAIVMWTIDLDIDRPWRHALQAIGTVGGVEDPEADKTRFSAAVGVAYAFRF